MIVGVGTTLLGLIGTTTSKPITEKRKQITTAMMNIHITTKTSAETTTTTITDTTTAMLTGSNQTNTTTETTRI
jgi:hypothetical protein